MALFSECTDSYAQKLLDTADIVREAIFQHLGVEPTSKKVAYHEKDFRICWTVAKLLSISTYMKTSTIVLPFFSVA